MADKTVKTEEEKELEQGQDTEADDGAPSVVDIGKMSPEEKTALITGTDPDDTEKTPEPGEEEGEDGVGDAEDKKEPGKEKPEGPLSEEDLKSLSPEDPTLSDESRARHPALKKERMLRRQAEKEAKRQKRENEDLKKFKEDFETLKSDLATQMRQPREEGGAGSSGTPNFDQMDPGEFYKWVSEHLETNVAKSVVDVIRKEFGTEKKEPGDLAFQVLDPQGDQYSPGVQYNFSDEEYAEVERSFENTSRPYVMVRGRDAGGREMDFPVFDREALTEIDEDIRDRVNSDQIYNSMFSEPHGLLHQFLRSDNTGEYLRMLESSDPAGALIEKFKSLYTKTVQDGTLKLPDITGKVKPPPQRPTIEDKEHVDPQGLGPGSTTGGAVQPGSEVIDANEISPEEMAKLTKEQHEEAIMTGFVTIG